MYVQDIDARKMLRYGKSSIQNVEIMFSIHIPRKEKRTSYKHAKKQKTPWLWSFSSFLLLSSKCHIQKSNLHAAMHI